jgi:CheY-like chemotaxis protein
MPRTLTLVEAPQPTPSPADGLASAHAPLRPVAHADRSAELRSLSFVSHELRTPLAAVLGALELLGGCPLDDAGERYTSAAREAASELLEILNRTLDDARNPDAPMVSLVETDFSPAELLDGILRQFGPLACQRGLALARSPGPDPEVRLTGDALRIRQIVANLVGNALKFTRTGDVRIGGRLLPDGMGRVRLVVDVQDTGPGVSAELRQRLFTPYARELQSDGTSGTGLGLAISRDLAHRMGGTLDLISTSSVGTHFQLRLPLRVQAATTRPHHDATPVASPFDARTVAGRPRRVLVVDDSVLNLNLVRRMLQRGGHVVATAATGAEALARAAHQSFDVALVDLELPDMEGLEVTRRLRLAQTPGTPLVVVALTGHTEASMRRSALAAGMDDVMTKPFRMQDLLERVEREPT